MQVFFINKKRKTGGQTLKRREAAHAFQIHGGLQKLLQTIADREEEALGVHFLCIRQGRHRRKVAGHDAVLFDRLQGCLFKLVRKGAQLRQVVQLAALTQRACPRKQCCDGVCGGCFALQIFVVVALYRAVRGFILVNAVRGDNIIFRLLEEYKVKDMNYKM